VLALSGGADPRQALAALSAGIDSTTTIVGIGAPLVLALGRSLSALRAFPTLCGPGCAIPSTQGAAWTLLRGDDRGEVHHRTRALLRSLGSSFVVADDVECFVHRGGRDLSGYEDGTENPKGDDAVATAIAAGAGPGMDGASFAAVQRWTHDLESFLAKPKRQRDAIIGRRIDDNAEIDDAPATAHVKRAAQESYEPPAFMVRRSMPWSDGADEGLVFIAFGASLDPYERVLNRMAGLTDGIVDALFSYSRPVTGGYYFCPPVQDGRLDLRAIE
jgi:porphyrinogen peroxidase